MTPAELSAIRARDAELGDWKPAQVEADRRALLAYVDELREAARKVTCWRCEGYGELKSPYEEGAGMDDAEPCPDQRGEAVKDLREIFLQPECCADEHTGRLWCEDDAPVDCEDDDGNEIPWTRYVRADLHDSLAAEIESLRSRLAEAEALLREAREGLDDYWVTTDAGKDAVVRIDAFLARERFRCPAVLGNAGQCYKPEGHDGQHSLFDASIPPWKQHG